MINLTIGKINVINAVLITLLVFVLFIAKLKMIVISVALGMFTASGSMLVAVIEKKVKSIHLGT